MEKCTDTHWGVNCSCAAGWKLLADGQNCTGMNAKRQSLSWIHRYSQL